MDGQGLYGKYIVRKADSGEAVTDCFVLRPEKDPAAMAALREYARATENEALSGDILRWVEAIASCQQMKNSPKIGALEPKEKEDKPMEQVKPNEQDVMEALHIHSTDGDCIHCPYNWADRCTTQLTRDALALLEEAETE